eukprot:764143-Hanusia_phi.AAC.3
MARSSMAGTLDENLKEADALKFVASLMPDQQRAKTGCYCIRCIRLGGCPIACFFNMSSGRCLWLGCSTILYGCCIVLCKSQDGVYRSIFSGMKVMKVDHKSTLACYTKDCGGPCCFCDPV